MKLVGRPKFLISVFLFLTALEVFAENLSIDIQESDSSPLYIAKSMLVFEDKTNQLDFDSIRSRLFESKFIKVPSSEEAFNFSYSQSTYWLKIQLKNTNLNSKEIALVVSYPRLQTLDL